MENKKINDQIDCSVVEHYVDAQLKLRNEYLKSILFHLRCLCYMLGIITILIILSMIIIGIYMSNILEFTPYYEPLRVIIDNTSGVTEGSFSAVIRLVHSI